MGVGKGVQVFNAAANKGTVKGVKKKAASTGTKKKSPRTLKLAPGGAAKSKSRVNEAGNYTKPAMRKRQFQRIKAGSKGGDQDNGQHEKRKCLHRLIKRQEAATAANYDSRFSPVCVYRHRGERETGQQRHVLS